MTTEAEASATEALKLFFEAWNSADIERVRATLNYPHLTLGPAGQVVVAQTAADFQTDFERLRQAENWHHSTLDTVVVTATIDTKVHFETTYSRYHPDGSRYGTGRVLYVVTNQGGHWGMQFRSGMPPAG